MTVKANLGWILMQKLNHISDLKKYYENLTNLLNTLGIGENRQLPDKENIIYDRQTLIYFFVGMPQTFKHDLIEVCFWKYLVLTTEDTILEDAGAKIQITYHPKIVKLNIIRLIEGTFLYNSDVMWYCWSVLLVRWKY